MSYKLNDDQLAKLEKLVKLYGFTEAGKRLTNSDIINILLEWADKYDKEFEEFMNDVTEK